MAMQSQGGGGGRRRRGRGRSRTPMADINVTPLVDVMLVLLIIFMVTAPLLVSGVPVELPESKAKALDQKQEPVEVSIDKEGQVFVDGTAVNEAQMAQLFAALAQKQDEQNPRQIMLRGDREIGYGQMMKVMGELNHAGLNSVSLVTTGSVTGGSSVEN
jgi:biopolymer transport protein TolR